MMKRNLLLLVGLFFGLPAPLLAYHFITFESPSGRILTIEWAESRFPVPYYVNNTEPLDFSLDTAVQAVQQSFRTWEDVETSNITFEFRGVTDAEPFEFFDGQSTLGFTSDPDLALPGVLGATLPIVNIFTGEIDEADIFFSNFFLWSVDPNGEPNTFDFVSVATHEIGHFLGLDHSHVGFIESTGFRRQLVSGSSIMYPFSFGTGSTEGRFLTVDDEVGLSILYPAGLFLQTTGSLAGTVTKGGRGVGFAHVVAFNPFTEETVGAFADADGNYRIRGLGDGPYVVRVNPITDPASPGDFTLAGPFPDLDFRDALYTSGRAEVVVPGETSGIDIEVQP